MPYAAHLLGTASIALEHGADEDEAIGALLHDSVEDAKGDATSLKNEIRRRYGAAVLDIVLGCTDTEERPKPAWKTRKTLYLEHLRDAAPSVRLVSAAEKLHNARAILRDYRTLGDALWGRFAASKEDVLWYYRALSDAFLASGPKRLADELDQVVSEITRLVTSSRA